MEEKVKIPFCPKNVRQIGEIDDTYKIYVEDYVATFLKQLVKKEEVGSRAILLLGEHYQIEETVYYFIYGAVCGTKQRLEEGLPLFEEEEKEYLLQIKNQSFNQRDIIGWAVIESQFNTVSIDSLWKDMGQEFSGENKLLFRIEQEDKKQNFYIHNYNIITKIEGYQIFYDSNEEMQNYLVEWHQQNKDSPTEQVRDIAMKQFRTVVSKKKEAGIQQKTLSFLYAATSMLLILMCAMGVTMLNNYEKLKRVETAMNHLLESMEEEKEMLALQGKQQKDMTQTSVGVATKAETTEAETTKHSILYEDNKENAEQETQQQEITQTKVNIVAPPMEYIVNAGDTLIGISKRFYQTSEKMKEICEINQISNPNNIVQGQKILLP